MVESNGVGFFRTDTVSLRSPQNDSQIGHSVPAKGAAINLKRPKAFAAGVQLQDLDGTTVRVYSRENTLADCFKYRNKVGLDNQAAVSKREKRSDLRIRMLRAVVAAMGGQLVIRARFPDGEKELCFEEEDTRSKAAESQSQG